MIDYHVEHIFERRVKMIQKKRNGAGFSIPH